MWESSAVTPWSRRVAGAAIALGSLTSAGPAGAGTTSTLAPITVSFVSARVGWVLGARPCAARSYCLGLARTTDGGRNWSAVTLPTPLASPQRTDPVARAVPGLSLTVASAGTAWLYGATTTSGGDVTTAIPLWSTFDGGRHWVAVSLRTLGLTAVAAMSVRGTTAYVVGWTSTGVALVRTAPVGSSRWSPAPLPRLDLPAGGGEGLADFVDAPGRTWLVVGNDRGVSAGASVSGTGPWRSWTGACHAVGDSYSVPVALTATRMLATCVMGGFASPLSPRAPTGASLGSQWLYQSSDGGRTFTAVAPIPSRPFSALVPIPGVPAAPAPGVIVAGGGIGANATPALLRSADGGRTWRAVLARPVVQADFPGSRVGYAIALDGTTRGLLTSHDAGAHWSALPVRLPNVAN